MSINFLPQPVNLVRAGPAKNRTKWIFPFSAAFPASILKNILLTVHLMKAALHQTAGYPAADCRVSGPHGIRQIPAQARHSVRVLQKLIFLLQTFVTVQPEAGLQPAFMKIQSYILTFFSISVIVKIKTGRWISSQSSILQKENFHGKNKAGTHGNRT